MSSNGQALHCRKLFGVFYARRDTQTDRERSANCELLAENILQLPTRVACPYSNIHALVDFYGEITGQLCTGQMLCLNALTNRPSGVRGRKPDKLRREKRVVGCC